MKMTRYEAITAVPRILLDARGIGDLIEHIKDMYDEIDRLNRELAQREERAAAREA